MFFFTPVVATLSAAATLARAYTLRSVSSSPTGQSAGNFSLQQSARGYTLSSGQAYASQQYSGGLPSEQYPSEWHAGQPIAVHIEGGKLMMTCPSQMQAVLIPSGFKNPPSWTVEFVLETEGLPEGTVIDGWTTTDDNMGLPATGRYTKIVNSIGNYGGYYAPLLLGDGETEALAWSNRTCQHTGTPSGGWLSTRVAIPFAEDGRLARVWSSCSRSTYVGMKCV